MPAPQLPHASLALFGPIRIPTARRPVVVHCAGNVATHQESMEVHTLYSLDDVLHLDCRWQSKRS